MLQITIVPDDRQVIVNGVAYIVDCSSVDPDIHAVQWRGEKGEIEFKFKDDVRNPNQKITDMRPFQAVIELWNVEHAKAVEEAKKAPKSDIPPEVQARRDQFKADHGRQNLIALLRQSSPDDINRYVDSNVKDLDSAKQLLALILRTIASA